MAKAKQLYVLRHAKSSWDDPGMEDHDRPLAERGRRACAAMGTHMRSAGVEPALVLCSSARRARQTLERVDPPGEWLIERELYGASADALVERLRRAPEQTPALMLIGHNPAVQMLVVGLAWRASDERMDALAEVEQKFPTGALATLELQCAWSELGAGAATLRSFVRPRQLT